jgi:two-component system sensor histidine kinase RegB
LGTIAVIAKELVRDLPAGSPFAEDAQLLLSETARCRTILAQLGERRDRDAVPHIDTVPVSALSDAVMQSITRAPGIEIAFRSLGGDDDQPMVTVTPELIHGLGNLIHNATTFARRQVTVTTAWDERWITMDIVDDGPGFSPQVLSRVGEPYLSSRSEDSDHMGLGIFIADTLLQRTGAVLTFANSPQGGAKVVVSWPRAMLDQEA